MYNFWEAKGQIWILHFYAINAKYIDRVRLTLNNISSKSLSFYKVPPEKVGNSNWAKIS